MKKLKMSSPVRGDDVGVRVTLTFEEGCNKYLEYCIWLVQTE